MASNAHTRAREAPAMVALGEDFFVALPLAFCTEWRGQGVGNGVEWLWLAWDAWGRPYIERKEEK